MKIVNLGIAAALVAAMVGVAYSQLDATPSNKEPKPDAVVDSAGQMRIPGGYRTTYQLLGSWVVSAEGEGPKELHVVYASPGTITLYLKDGRFSDGAVLVKEVFETATGQFTTGTVSHAQTLKGWFLMVKDGTGRYPGNKLWADGWGWAWFDAGNPSKTTTTDYEAECRSYHLPARATDWVYVDGYPPLKR